MARVITVANAVAVPSALKVATRWRIVATTRHSPTMPLQVIIAAAKTVSRASVSVSEPPAAISTTMSATSITVTAIARTSDPSGSPTRCATTSAWCTAASTAAASSAATSASTAFPGFDPQVVASATRATAGTMSVHGTRRNQRGREPGAMTGIYCPQEPRSQRT